MNIPPQIDQMVLQRRLRSLLIVASLLLPTFCVFGGLALAIATQEISAAAWLALVIWVSVGALLGAVIARILRTLATLNELRAEATGDKQQTTGDETARQGDQERGKHGNS